MCARRPVRPADPNAPPPPPDPNTLPGFTEGSLPVEPIEGAKINVATEERDPNSVLNAYRELIALHHGNATVRNGEQVVLNRDAQNALVWVRRAPAGSRTVANVVVAANLGDKPVTLQIDEDLQHLGITAGAAAGVVYVGAAANDGREHRGVDVARTCGVCRRDCANGVRAEIAGASGGAVGWPAQRWYAASAVFFRG